MVTDLASCICTAGITPNTPPGPAAPWSAPAAIANIPGRNFPLFDRSDDDGTPRTIDFSGAACYPTSTLAFISDGLSA